MTSKMEIRTALMARRRDRKHRAEASRQICERLQSLPEWESAREILFYVNAHSEVMTRPLLEKTLTRRGSAVVPWCQGNSLELARIEQMGELAAGSYGIPEPIPEVRQSSFRKVAAGTIDLVLIPGVAFDSGGGRLGYGKGYYDRLLTEMPRESVRVALAFECQLIEKIPREDHDMLMDLIVTESRVIHCPATADRGGGEGKQQGEKKN